MSSYRPVRSLTARWRPEDGPGLEHAALTADAEGIVIRSVVIGEREAEPYGVWYTIVCDAGWAVRSLDLATTDGRVLALRSSGRGGWTDAQGRRLDALDGCVDVDLAGTPFTNTLPIRRLGLSPGGPTAELRMVYVPFTTFVPVVDEQLYRCLDGSRRYRYEAADRSFAATITVDDDGLVLHYPPLFRRIP